MSGQSQDDLKPFQVWCPEYGAPKATIKAKYPRVAAEVFVECSDAIQTGDGDEVEVHVLDDQDVLRKYTVEVEADGHLTATEIKEDDV